MIDTRRGWSIGAKVDVWMFGCVAFMLAFGRHPFQEQGKLAIVNASYSLQPSEVKDSPLAPIVKATLVPNPSLRPTA
jgi:cyclin G-associated kinase